MNKTYLKSVGACFTGIIVGVVLTLVTDEIMKGFGIIPKDSLWVSSTIIWCVLFYRVVFNTFGSYIVARLAPNHKMNHVIFVGVLGTLISVLGAIATKDMNLGPAWYAWTLAALTLPSSWIGGKLALSKK